MDNIQNYMKGLTEAVMFNSEPLLNWDVTLLPLDSMDCLQASSVSCDTGSHDHFNPGNIYIGRYCVLNGSIRFQNVFSEFLSDR